MSWYLKLFLILYAANTMAQAPEQTKLKGKIRARISDIEGVYVINKNTEAAVTTDKEGFFSITAVEGDTLLFSAIQYKVLKLVLTCGHFEKDFIIVNVEPAMNLLNEVIIRKYDNINAVSLGIIPKGQKSYTQAERLLKTANSLDASASVGGMAGGSVSADPLFNWISGRTAMLKKGVEVESKIRCIQKLEYMFDKNHFINKLGIPAIYVKGFEYFAVENDKFTKILNSGNKTVIEFLLGELAVKYKSIIANE
ncbi:carboxypeptidase-like regulatory domain-containing protein [Flavobacterium sp. K5-23]|uniref:carboxypeptidase-like regulatory domain-containing protein n=1 Tax=Flavobacterium sp. K5-23 TaxID=2746225 RepID=UPI00200F103D|nr:carboxypeptidase-like regulatory domain-containing protein [Flavobacterium sp. K5-23]UQD55080.1 hypothetical protein FLAK523_01220 [Flavobacterium sp. K5-23]